MSSVLAESSTSPAQELANPGAISHSKPVFPAGVDQRKAFGNVGFHQLCWFSRVVACMD